MKTEAPARLFPRELCKIVNNTYFLEYQQTVTSNDMIMARFFRNFYCLLLFVINFYCLFLLIMARFFRNIYSFLPANIFNESQENDHIATLLTCSDTNPVYF